MSSSSTSPVTLRKTPQLNSKLTMGRSNLWLTGGPNFRSKTFPACAP